MDRFNDPDRDLFQMLWEELKELRVSLPMIERGEFKGEMSPSVYDYDFIMVPAASARSMNPEIQYGSNKDLFSLFAQLQPTGVPVDLRAGAMYLGMHANPDLTRVMLPDPNAIGPGGQMPINVQYQQLQQMVQMLQQAGAALETRVNEVAKLAVETDDKVDEAKGKVDGVHEVFNAAGVSVPSGNGSNGKRPYPSRN